MPLVSGKKNVLTRHRRLGNLHEDFVPLDELQGILFGFKVKIVPEQMEWQANLVLISSLA